MSTRVAVFLTASVGLISSVFYAITWISRRQLLGETEIYLLGSRAILALPICLGVALAFHHRRANYGWAAYSILVSSLAVLSMNRATLLLFVAPLLMALPGFRSRLPLRRLFSFYVLLSGSLWALLTYFAPALLGEEFVKDRLNSVVDILTEGSESGDLSAVGRASLTEKALILFRDDPLLGAGLGSVNFVDTPALYLAKWGIVGSIFIAIFFIAVFAVLLRSKALGGFGHPVTAPLAMGLVGAWSLSLLSGAPTEDIGLALALALVFLFRVSCVSTGPPEFGLEGRPVQ